MIVYITSVYSLPKNLLGHVLNHYTAQGVDKFVFAVSCKDAWNEIKAASKTHNIELHEETRPWWVNTDSDFKNEIRQTLSPDDWIVPADLDEFHFHRKFTSLKSLAESAQEYDGVCSVLIDRITEDGSIPSEILPDVPLTLQFPRRSTISRDTIKCCVSKVCLLRQHIPIVSGHHYLPTEYKRFPTNATTFHYKWFGNVREKEVAKMNEYLKRNEPWHVEMARLIDYLDKNNGKLQ